MVNEAKKSRPCHRAALQTVHTVNIPQSGNIGNGHKIYTAAEVVTATLRELMKKSGGGK